MFALQFDTERLEHRVYLVDPSSAAEAPAALIEACAAFDRRTTRVTVLATSPWPAGRAIIKAHGCDFVELGSGYQRKRAFGRFRHLAKRLRELRADELRFASGTPPELRLLRLTHRRPRAAAFPEIRRHEDLDSTRIAFVLKSDLASATANVGQALRTAASLAAAGAAVRVIAPLSSGTFDDVAARLGIEHGVTSLQHRAIPTITRSLETARALAEVIADAASDGFGTLYFRQARIASMVVPPARAAGMRTWMEAHQPYTTWSLCQRRDVWADTWSEPVRCRSLRAMARWDREYERELYHRLDGVACTTEAMRRHVERLGGRGKAVLLRNGAPAASPPLADAQRDVDVIYSGRTHARKGTDVLMAAIASLDGVRASIIGGPTEADLAPYRQMAMDYGVAGRVEFEPWMDAGELFDRVRRARVAVHPIAGRESREWRLFTCPLKIVEAMALGTPVISTDLPAIRELIEPDVTGVLVEPGNPRALAAVIEGLLRDPARRARLAAAAQESIQRWNDRARGAEILRWVTAETPCPV